LWGFITDFGKGLGLHVGGKGGDEHVVGINVINILIRMLLLSLIVVVDLLVACFFG